MCIIIMSLNNGHFYKTPATLTKALEVINSLPTSIEVQETEFYNFCIVCDRRLHSITLTPL